MLLSIERIYFSRCVFTGIPIEKEYLLKFVSSMLDHFLFVIISLAIDILAFDHLYFFILHSELILVIFLLMITLFILPPPSDFSIIFARVFVLRRPASRSFNLRWCNWSHELLSLFLDVLQLCSFPLFFFLFLLEFEFFPLFLRHKLEIRII